MRRRTSVCVVPGCPTLTDQHRCAAHRSEQQREQDQQRGSRQARGYDRTHDRLRQHWQERLDRGEQVTCARPDCLTPGVPVDPRAWDLGHNELRQHRGPEHRACNRATNRKASA